jgi:hypothetical protein
MKTAYHLSRKDYFHIFWDILIRSFFKTPILRVPNGILPVAFLSSCIFKAAGR